MAQRVGMEVSVAIGEVVKLANADVVAAYPITPQTHIVEHIAELVADGELDAEYVPVESEHSAMSACLGSAAAGARTFTATAGQGLELMHGLADNFFKTADWQLETLPGGAVQRRYKFLTTAADS